VRYSCTDCFRLAVVLLCFKTTANAVYISRYSYVSPRLYRALRMSAMALTVFVMAVASSSSIFANRRNVCDQSGRS